MKRLPVTHYPIEGKTVLVRVDYNVPMKNGRVLTNAKIKASLPTIKYLISKNCKVVLLSHLGRPKGKVVPNLKLIPVYKELLKFFPKWKVKKLQDCIGKDIKTKIESGGPGDIFLLENVRFYAEEKKNDPAFAHSLANLADVYVNEAFSNSHRKHASMEAITHFLPALSGLHLEKEIQHLTLAIKGQRPVVWILGGAKLDKTNLIEKVMKRADYVLVGGALAFAFMKAQNIPVGHSLTNPESVAIARKIIGKKAFRQKLILPLDFVASPSFSARGRTETIKYNQFNREQIGLDLGPETVRMFKHFLRPAHTIVWNGPLGYFEWAKFAEATRDIGRFITTLPATTIAGGGETIEAVHKFHLQDKLTHVSTGGGASLAFLAGERLPALDALQENYQRLQKKR